MARIALFSENYGGPGTGMVIHNLAVALSRMGHSVQAKTSLKLSDGDINGIQVDLVIGQHKAAGLGRMVANRTGVPFVMVMQGERYTSSMKADLVVFTADSYIQGYKNELVGTAAISIERGSQEFCEKVTALAEASAVVRQQKAVDDAAAKAANAPPKPSAPYVPPQSFVQSFTQSFVQSRPPTQQSRPIVENRKHEPTVSVIVVAQNDEKTVTHTVQSVLAQSHKTVEVILVDDGSDDSTPKMLSAITDPRAMVFRRPWKSGRHSARNLGFSQSSGDFIMFLDAGDTLTTDAIGALLARIQADSTPGCTFGKSTNMMDVHRRWVFAAGGVTDADALKIADTVVSSSSD